MNPTLYLRCQPGQVAPLVLLTGDPARVERIGAAMDEAEIITQNREFITLTGRYRGQAITAVSAGIGAPSTAIAIEELKALGARAVVRIGTMMGVEAPMGTAVIATAAARFEGTSAAYLPAAYPAVADWGLVSVLAESARQHELDVRLGATMTCDAFYPQMAPSLVGRGALDLDMARRARILALDMETSLVYILGAALGLAAAALCLVTVQAEPSAMLEAGARARGDAQMIRAALDGLAVFGA